jgi:3-dehydroquinate synthase
VALALDADLLERLEADPGSVLDRDPAVLEDVVSACVRVKAEIVAEDERDAARRLFLNYGHTLGHALERVEAFAGRSHGEAVAVGMVFAARLSEALGRGAPGLATRHARLLAALGLEADGALPAPDAVLEAMRMDKKYRGGVRFVLLEDVGRPFVQDGVHEALLRETLAAMGSRVVETEG